MSLWIFIEFDTKFYLLDLTPIFREQTSGSFLPSYATQMSTTKLLYELKPKQLRTLGLKERS